MKYSSDWNEVSLMCINSGPDVNKMFNFSLVMAMQGIMMDLQQSVGPGFFSPLLSPRKSTTWYMFVISKQAVLRYLQALENCRNP